MSKSTPESSSTTGVSATTGSERGGEAMSSESYSDRLEALRVIDAELETTDDDGSVAALFERRKEITDAMRHDLREALQGMGEA